MAKYLDETGAEQLNQLLAAKFDTKVDKYLATKTYTNILGVADDTTYAENTFYFASIKPTTFTDTWAVRYRIYIWCENDNNYRAMSECWFMGVQSGVASYAIFNNIYSTSYRPAYYHTMYRLLQDGFNAGYGHALGFSLKDANAKDTAGKERSVKVDILQQVNCQVTLLNNVVKWGSWEGNNTTNYSGADGSPSTYNFSANGLQETGDANNDTVGYQLRTNSSLWKNKTGYAMNRYTLLFEVDDGLSGAATTIGTGTSKVTINFKYIPNGIIKYYTTSGKIANDSDFAATGLWNQYVLDLRYTFNIGSTLVSGKPVYVRCSVNTDGTLTPNYAGSPSHPIVQALPSTADGYAYVYLGQAYSTTNIELRYDHPIYEFKDGKIREWQYDKTITSSDVTTALGYTPYSAENPNGYTSNTGTITKVQANGTDVASSGTANIPAASTSAYGVTKLSNATDSTSEVLAATPKAVKAAYDLAAGKGTGTITGVSVNGTSVATSGVANITSVPASILSGAIPSAVTATTQTASDNSTKIATTAFVQTAIDNLPEPMVFKGSLGTGGTITALPTNGTANIGDTYKVITAGTYASQAAKVGDTFICLTKTGSANTWELIPSGDEPSGTVTSITIKATSPIAIDNTGTITTSGTRTLSHATSGVTTGTYRSVTVNNTGHVTAGTNPTTLSGYGITDAKIASGVITLGSNTITPLTSASTLDATKLSGTIPSGCYTDTKNTAGSTDSSSKLFLIGATSQTASSQTYSQDTAYVGTDGKLYSNSKEVVNLSDTQALTNKTYNGYTLAAASAKAVDTSISAGSSSANLPTSAAVATFVEGKGYVTTDTKNTAGSTDTSSKIYLIGAESQAANPQTYSDNEVFVKNGVLNAQELTIGSRADDTPIGTGSSAQGYNITATGSYSHAEGASTTASEMWAHAEGNSTTASGFAAHAEGERTAAYNSSCHAEGIYSTASGSAAHAEGENTEASGNTSHAEGQHTRAQRKSQHVQGEYNIVDIAGTTTTRGTYAHIVGNGTSNSTRSNAHTLDWSGNAWYAGNVYVGSTSGTNKDAGSKKLITADEISTNINTITPAQIDAIFAI